MEPTCLGTTPRRQQRGNRANPHWNAASLRPQPGNTVQHGAYAAGNRVLAPRAVEIAEALLQLPHMQLLDRLAAEEIGGPTRARGVALGLKALAAATPRAGGYVLAERLLADGDRRVLGHVVRRRACRQRVRWPATFGPGRSAPAR